MVRRNRYDDDPGGKFTSVVTSGNGKPVTSGSGKAVMSRSFGREPVYAPVPMTRTQAPAKPKVGSSSSTGGRVRHKAQASSTGGPARYSGPSLSYGPPTRGQRTAQTKDVKPAKPKTTKPRGADRKRPSR